MVPVGVAVGGAGGGVATAVGNAVDFYDEAVVSDHLMNLNRIAVYLDQLRLSGESVLGCTICVGGGGVMIREV